MLSKIVGVIGWFAMVAGALVSLVSLFMLLIRSSTDFEGMLVGAAVGSILLIGLPALVVGLIMVSFAKRMNSSDAT